MNIIIPLTFGIVVGYLLRGKIRLNTEILMSASIIILVFLMGMKIGNVKINTGRVAIYSILLATLTIVGSLVFAKITWEG